MSQPLQRAANRIRAQLGGWLRARADECTSCRDCGGQVAPWDECCNNCGRGNPAEVSSSAVVAVTLSAIVMLALVILATVL